MPCNYPVDPEEEMDGLEDRVAELIEHVLEGSKADVPTSIATLRAATVLAKMTNCPRHVFLSMCEKMFDNTEVAVIDELPSSMFCRSENKIGEA